MGRCGVCLTPFSTSIIIKMENKDKTKIPEYINCKSKYTVHCNYYLHPDCLETCKFAEDSRELGIGGLVDLTEIKFREIRK